MDRYRLRAGSIAGLTHHSVYLSRDSLVSPWPRRRGRSDRAVRSPASVVVVMGCPPSAMNGLHLSHPAIHEQFRSRDVATVVGASSSVARPPPWEPPGRSVRGSSLQAYPCISPWFRVRNYPSVFQSGLAITREGAKLENHVSTCDWFPGRAWSVP